MLVYSSFFLPRRVSCHASYLDELPGCRTLGSYRSFVNQKRVVQQRNGVWGSHLFTQVWRFRRTFSIPDRSTESPLLASLSGKCQAEGMGHFVGGARMAIMACNKDGSWMDSHLRTSWRTRVCVSRKQTARCGDSRRRLINAVDSKRFLLKKPSCFPSINLVLQHLFNISRCLRINCALVWYKNDLWDTPKLPDVINCFQSILLNKF